MLILDDLGTQNATAWAQEKLFQIFNHRYNAMLPTVVTTNLSLDRIDERLRMRLTDPAIARVYYVEAAARAIDVNLPDSLDLDRIREMTFESFDITVPHLQPGRALEPGERLPHGDGVRRVAGGLAADLRAQRLRQDPPRRGDREPLPGSAANGRSSSSSPTCWTTCGT